MVIAPLTFIESLALIVKGLNGTIAHRACSAVAIRPLLVFVCIRLCRMLSRVERLVARWRAGTLPKPRPSRAGKPRKPSDLRSPQEGLKLPTGHMWLVKLVQETIQRSTQLEHLLTDAELITFLREVPQAQRLLRPLCRGLGLRPLPAPLRLPDKPPCAPRPPKPRPLAAPPKPRPRRPLLWPGPRKKNAVSLW